MLEVSVTSETSVCFRAEEAEGVGDPCDTNQLNLNPACTDSKLLRGLWATALLLGPNGLYLYSLGFNLFSRNITG